MHKVRQKFLNGETPVGCAGCTSAEKAGNESKRITDNKRFSHHKNNKLFRSSNSVFQSSVDHQKLSTSDEVPDNNNF